MNSPSAMIFGIGVDIVKVDRIKGSVERFGEAFLKRIFTQEELAYCMCKRNPYPSLAARFAAKEAMIKSLSSHEHIPLKDIEVMVMETGKPYIRPGVMLEIVLKEHGIRNVHLSLSHEREYAVAHVVLEARERESAENKKPKFNT